MKRLDETKWPRPSTRPPRDPRRRGPRPRRDRDETLIRLETVSRPRRRDRDHIPDLLSQSDICCVGPSKMEQAPPSNCRLPRYWQKDSKVISSAANRRYKNVCIHSFIHSIIHSFIHVCGMSVVGSYSCSVLIFHNKIYPALCGLISLFVPPSNIHCATWLSHICRTCQVHFRHTVWILLLNHYRLCSFSDFSATI